MIDYKLLTTRLNREIRDSMGKSQLLFSGDFLCISAYNTSSYMVEVDRYHSNSRTNQSEEETISWTILC